MSPDTTPKETRSDSLIDSETAGLSPLISPNVLSAQPNMSMGPSSMPPDQANPAPTTSNIPPTPHLQPICPAFGERPISFMPDLDTMKKAILSPKIAASTLALTMTPLNGDSNDPERSYLGERLSRSLSDVSYDECWGDPNETLSRPFDPKRVRRPRSQAHRPRRDSAYVSVTPFSELSFEEKLDVLRAEGVDIDLLGTDRKYAISAKYVQCADSRCRLAPGCSTRTPDETKSDAE